MKNKDSRLLLIFFFFVILFSIVIVRLFYWQVVEAEGLSDLARLQSSQTLVNTARRGDILFSDGFPLATNKINYLLYANPKEIDDVLKYTNLLSPALSLDSASVAAVLSKDLFWLD